MLLVNLDCRFKSSVLDKRPASNHQKLGLSTAEPWKEARPDYH